MEISLFNPIIPFFFVQKKYFSNFVPPFEKNMYFCNEFKFVINTK